MDITTYRMTSGEYDRFLFAYDDLSEEFGTDGFKSLLQANAGKWVNDPCHGQSFYDAGDSTYWVRTSHNLDWM